MLVNGDPFGASSRTEIELGEGEYDEEPRFATPASTEREDPELPTQPPKQEDRVKKEERDERERERRTRRRRRKKRTNPWEAQGGEIRRLLRKQIRSANGIGIRDADSTPDA